MTETSPTIQKTPNLSQIPNTPETALLGDLFRGMIEPLAKSQEISAKEVTRQVEMKASVATKMHLMFFGVVVLLIAFAFVAMLLEKDQIMQTMISTATLLIGVAVGRVSKKVI